MPVCAFCGKEILPGTGLLYVHRSGKTSWFCSRKCRNLALEKRRKSIKVRWTMAYRKAKSSRTKT